MLLARHRHQQRPPTMLAMLDVALERRAQLMHHFLQPAQRQGDAGEVAGIGAPELAKMAGSRCQEIEIQGLDRHAIGSQPVDIGEGGIGILAEHDIGELDDLLRTWDGDIPLRGGNQFRLPAPRQDQPRDDLPLIVRTSRDDGCEAVLRRSTILGLSTKLRPP